MSELVLVQLPRTARGALVAAFESVGVRVHLVDHLGEVTPEGPLPHDAVRAAVLRHPIDRLQSWFHLRLRAGRPYRPTLWTDWEAAFFTALPSFDRFGEAFCSVDEFLRSAAERGFTMWGHSAGSLAATYGPRQPPDIEIAGSLDDLPAAVERLASMVGCAVPLLLTDPSVIDATPPSLPSGRSALAELGLRARLAEELDHYGQLLGERHP